MSEPPLELTKRHKTSTDDDNIPNFEKPSLKPPPVAALPKKTVTFTRDFDSSMSANNKNETSGPTANAVTPERPATDSQVDSSEDESVVQFPEEMEAEFKYPTGSVPYNEHWEDKHCRKYILVLIMQLQARKYTLYGRTRFWKAIRHAELKRFSRQTTPVLIRNAQRSFEEVVEKELSRLQDPKKKSDYESWAIAGAGRWKILKRSIASVNLAF
jgi:hypothetical protein